MISTNDRLEYDERKAEAFADQLVATLNHGAVCLMISIGHRTGLFDTLRELPPATSAEIARKADLAERYVREWLGAMVTARIVELDADGVHYQLPPEHAAFLTRAAAADNLAVFTQYVSVLGSVEDDVVRCFERGGGVPYEKYCRFHAVMAEDSGQSVLSSLESHILPLVPRMRERLQQGARMLDAGCGRGRILIHLAGKFPSSRFVGMDLSRDAIEHARAEATRRNLENVEFVCSDLGTFQETAPRESFDFITTFDAVHDQAAPLNLLLGIHRALKPDGVYMMQEIKGSSHVGGNMNHPIAPFLYTISCMHCMTVSLAQGGEGLGAMWGEEKAREYLSRAGFRSVEKNELAHDIQNDWYVVAK